MTRYRRLAGPTSTSYWWAKPATPASLRGAFWRADKLNVILCVLQRTHFQQTSEYVTHDTFQPQT